MPILSLAAVARGPVRIREEIPKTDPAFREAGITLSEPVRMDLEARMVGEGVLVRGEIETQIAADCRRCLAPVPTRIRDTVDLLFEPLSGDEAVELGGEVYPLPERGDVLDLGPGIREQLLLRAPDFVVCAETCRGL